MRKSIFIIAALISCFQTFAQKVSIQEILDTVLQESDSYSMLYVYNWHDSIISTDSSVTLPDLKLRFFDRSSELREVWKESEPLYMVDFYVDQELSKPSKGKMTYDFFISRVTGFKEEGYSLVAIPEHVRQFKVSFSRSRPVDKWVIAKIDD